MRGKKKREEALDRDRIKGESRRARERVTGRQTGRETERTEKERFTSIIIIYLSIYYHSSKNHTFSVSTIFIQKRTRERGRGV